jgi:hypothetical protein
MNDFITQQFSSYNLFQAAGDVVELNAWVHDDIIDQIKQLNEDPTKIKQHRIKDSKDGPENGYWYNNVPDGWGLPQNARTVGCLLYDAGNYIHPHRDKRKSVQPNGEITGDSFRLVNYVNHTNPSECCFILDNKIIRFEPKRWYAINTQKLHQGMSFVDNVVHLSAALHFDRNCREETTSWLLDSIPFAAGAQDDVKGVACERISQDV